jgi:hypothetical protein
MKHLLWTGGWDSTFRLIELVRTGEEVQPHYLVDVWRESIRHELLAMDSIRRMIADRGWREPLPPRFTAFRDIPRIPAVREAFASIRRQYYIGGQYVYLSEYGHASDIRLEMAVHEGMLIQLFLDQVPQPASMRAAVALLCQPFEFPIQGVTKIEMGEIAQRAGYSDIMHTTWFCHIPTWRGTPCGICGPCKYTIQEGMGWRVPMAGRLKQRVATLVREGRSMVAKQKPAP